MSNDENYMLRVEQYLGKTYGGWTEREILEAEEEGYYIPRTVYIRYENGDYDYDEE